MLRGSGGFWDLRLTETYDNYNFFNFSIPIGINGDCYDRYICRIQEMRESLKIMSQALKFLNVFSKLGDTSYIINDFKIAPPSRHFMKYNMEGLIHHFKYYTEGFSISKEESCALVEAPKGEFSVYLVSDNSNKAYRCRIKAPGFLHLQGLNFLAKNLFLADLVTIIGSLDLVFGEIDR
jgi:NADH:ubiquinone oxidoreductase subunit D